LNIGEKIKAARKARGLTQIELAQKANISRSYLGDVEADRYNASVETLKAIALALSVDVATFFDDSAPAIEFNKRDQRDIAKTMDALREQLLHEEGLMFDGEPLSPEAIESILSAMKLGLEAAKQRNKEKYTPKNKSPKE